MDRGCRFLVSNYYSLFHANSFKDSTKFFYVFIFLNYFNDIRDIRNKFFNGNYSDSIEFLFFIFNIYTKLYPDIFFRPVLDYFDRLKCKIIISEFDWDDSEFDFFIYYLLGLVADINKVSGPRHFYEITNSSKCTVKNKVFSFQFILNKFNSLSFDTARQFFNDSEFGNWVSYSTGGSKFSNTFLNRGTVGSFQNQFNYSDSVAVASTSSFFRYVHTLYPIFSDMHDLPFAVNALRPYFDNFPIFHYFDSLKRLQYVSVYYMDTGMFSKILFDRYLYTHAKLLLNVPYTFTRIDEAKYVINFDSFYYSRNFFYYFNYLSDNWPANFKKFNFLLDITSCFKIHVRMSSYEVYVKFMVRKKIKQILLSSWIGIFKLKPFFNNVMIPFNSGEYYQVGSGYTRSVTHDYAGTFAGIPTDVAFDRVTSRLLQEFSKFLYLSNFGELNFIAEFIENGLAWVNYLLSSRGFESLIYSNALIENEYGYRGSRMSSLSGTGVFENLFIEFINYFFDYELWLFVFFGALVNMLDDPNTVVI